MYCIWKEGNREEIISNSKGRPTLLTSRPADTLCCHMKDREPMELDTGITYLVAYSLTTPFRM